MLLLDAFITRVNDAAAKAPPTVMLAFGRSPEAVMLDIDSKIAEVNGQLDSLKAQRVAATLAGAEGDPNGEKEADRLDTVIAAAERKVDRLLDARKDVADRAARAAVGKAAAAEQVRLNGVKKQTLAVHDAAQEAEQALAKFRDSMVGVAAALDTLRMSIGPEIHHAIVDFWAHVPGAINAALSEANPGRFHRSAFLPPERLSVLGNAARLFETEYMVGLAARAKAKG